MSGRTDDRRARIARPPVVAALVVGGVAMGIAGAELLRRFAPASAGLGGGVERAAAPADPSELGWVSQPALAELLFALLLAAARGLLLLRRRRRLLEPLLDLPLIAVLLAVTGGALSPLDPALPIVYVAAVLFLRGAERKFVSPRRVTLELLAGLLVTHLLVQRHDRALLERGSQAQLALVRGRIADVRAQHDTALASIETALREFEGPEPGSPPEAVAAANAESAEAFARMRGEIGQAQRRFARFLETLTPEVGAERLATAKLELQEQLDRIYEGYFSARDVWRANRPARPTGIADSIDNLRESQWTLRAGLLERVDEIEAGLHERDRLRLRQDAFLRASGWRRVTICGALLLFAGVALVLRDRLTEAVRCAEELRARAEIGLAERDKQNWIALTAGLTHGLGNDILAYDAYLGRLERLLAGGGPDASALEIVRFLADSNRGRLGFLRFLDTFARHRQRAGGDGPPIEFEALELEPLLRRTRANLARIETADLPQEGLDPAVDRRIRILRDLPLQIEIAEPRAATLVRGLRGAVEFFAYELLKNALRSATGERALLARLSLAGERLQVAVENDVQTETEPGPCPRCGASGPVRRVTRRRDEAAACERCFEPMLAALLDASFAPGKGGGTGLGLFLIRHFLTTFWDGEIRAEVVDPAVPVVRFTISLPDPEPAA